MDVDGFVCETRPADLRTSNGRTIVHMAAMSKSLASLELALSERFKMDPRQPDETKKDVRRPACPPGAPPSVTRLKRTTRRSPV